MIFGQKKNIYLDYASSTPVSQTSVKAFLDAQKLYANTQSIHKDGLQAKELLLEAKKIIAKTIRSRDDEIFFVSSGTESDNLAIQGVIMYAKKNGIENPHIVTTTIEHEAVLGTCRALENFSVSVTYVNPREDGIIDPKDIRDAINENTVLVSVMYVNNEIGTIQPIKDIAKEIRHFRKNNKTRFESEKFSNTYPLFHTDACQSTNYLDIDVLTLGVDLLTLNGAKCYCVKGAAMLYVKKDTPIEHIIFSGKNDNLTPGTPAISLASALASAIEESQDKVEIESERVSRLKNKIIEMIKTNNVLSQRIKFTVDNKIESCIPGILHMIVLGVVGELLVIELDKRGVSVSSQSACRSEDEEDSYVVKAIGAEISPKDGTLRVSIGRLTKDSDCTYFVKKLEEVVLKYKI